MVKFVNEKKLIYDIFDYDVILVGTSTYCILGNGFQNDIKINFPIVQEKNMETPYANSNKLGTILPVKERGVIFCLCFINKGRFRPDLSEDYLDYEALEKCLTQVREQFADKKIATTLIGGSKFDGDGNREKILSLFDKCCPDMNITIYDYVQVDKNKRHIDEWNRIASLIGKISVDEYYEIRNRFLWEEKMGIWNDHLKPPTSKTTKKKWIKTLKK